MYKNRNKQNKNQEIRKIKKISFLNKPKKESNIESYT